MLNGTDQKYLLNDQYKDATNLSVRMELHKRFGTSTIDWHRWVFDLINLPATARILELGCGPGQLWVRNLERIPCSWDVVLSDFSPGMVEQARANLTAAACHMSFELIDAQSIPFTDASFDGVVANHMLYHIPDRRKAYAEIKRILKPTGAIFAATNGRNNMIELKELAAAHGFGGTLFSDCHFDLEIGQIELKQQFSKVNSHLLEESLEVTEAEPLVNYILSAVDIETVTHEQVQGLRHVVEVEIKANGSFHIGKIAGLFVAEMA